MRYPIMTLIGATAVLVLSLLVVVYLVSRPSYTARVLSETSIRTTAPTQMVSVASQTDYEELRLRHFMDSTGRVTFPDGTSTDTTSNEMVSVTGDIKKGTRYFDDPDGNKVTLNWIREPKIGALLTWDYADNDPQTISIAFQRALAQQGVRIE